VESFEFKEYMIGFENKRDKIVVRMAEPLEPSEIVRNTEINMNDIQSILRAERYALKQEILTE